MSTQLRHRARQLRCHLPDRLFAVNLSQQFLAAVVFDERRGVFEILGDAAFYSLVLVVLALIKFSAVCIAYTGNFGRVMLEMVHVLSHAPARPAAGEPFD